MTNDDKRMSIGSGDGEPNDRDEVWSELIARVADMEEIRVEELAAAAGTTEAVAREVVVTAEGLGLVAKDADGADVWEPHLLESLVDRNDSRVYVRELKELVYGTE